jgi:hypothetical protein
LPRTTSNRLIGINSHEITCSGTAVASAIEYAFWRPAQAEVVVEEHHQQHGRGDFTSDPQQHYQVDVARSFGHHFEQGHRAGPRVAHQLVHPGQRHRADGGIDGREHPAQTDQRDSAEQLIKAGHGWSKYLDLSSSRRSLSSWRSYW